MPSIELSACLSRGDRNFRFTNMVYCTVKWGIFFFLKVLGAGAFFEFGRCFVQ